MEAISVEWYEIVLMIYAACRVFFTVSSKQSRWEEKRDGKILHTGSDRRSGGLPETN